MFTRTNLLTVALVFGLLGMGATQAVRAETRTAASLTPVAVWEAINAAQDGDTVQLPAGTADWTTGWNAGHGAQMKAIIIQGAGMDKTVICRTGKTGGSAFDLKGVEGKPFRVTGITFDGADFAGWGALMSISGTCKNFRIDHCKFKNAQSMISVSGDNYGLFDHCYFDGPKSHGGNVQPIGDYSGPGGDNYRKPLSLGTAQATFFEDNEVHVGAYAGTGGTRTGNNPWIAPNNCARVVIRHNKIVNSQLEIYAPGRNKQYGCQQCEIYDNEFSTEGEGRPQCSIDIAAGVAMVFNNTVTGPRNLRTITLENHRAYYVMKGSPFGKADGTNPIDGNEIPAGQVGAGYPCMGQPGRATNLKGSGSFDATPCYAWNNTYDGLEMRMTVRGPDPNELAQIKEGRDFFNQKPPEESYKPYVYPHPLQEGWETLMKNAAGSAAAGSGSPQTGK